MCGWHLDFMSGAWDDRGCTSNSADGSILLWSTVFCFAKVTKDFYDWFLGTSLYKKHLESFAKEKAMTKKTKRSIITMVTILMAIGFIMMNNVPIGRVVLVIVWIFHFLYFGLKVETVKEEKAKEIIYD